MNASQMRERERMGTIAIPTVQPTVAPMLTVETVLHELHVELVQRRHAAAVTDGRQRGRQDAVIALQQFVLPLLAQLLAQRRIEEVMQIDGGRCPAAVLKVHHHRAVRPFDDGDGICIGIIASVRVHRVVHPDVAVDERMEVAGFRVERPPAALQQMRSQRGQFAGVRDAVRPLGDAFAQRVQLAEIVAVEGGVLAVQHACVCVCGCEQGVG